MDNGDKIEIIRAIESLKLEIAVKNARDIFYHKMVEEHNIILMGKGQKLGIKSKILFLWIALGGTFLLSLGDVIKGFFK